MIDPTEAAFLRSIADGGDDDAARLVFADWLDERGDDSRAEFVRLQCEMASANLADDRRQALRLRERDLLNDHRQSWIRALGFPVEDVQFERGTVARLRLAKWDEGAAFVAAAQFATLTELDLSGLQIGDAGATLFAQSARLPALRKLILSENGITDAGAAALAQATGFPRLDTLYLFGNPITGVVPGLVGRSAHFRLTNLDTGVREDGYSLSPGETEMARRTYLRTQLLPVVGRYFQTYERLQSAMLCVAQYWADEADDAVHATLIVSELFEPTLEGVAHLEDSLTDPNLLTTHIPSEYGEGSSSEVSLWRAGARWDENSGAIPLWAAFAPEGGSQEYSEISEAYAPAVLFYRHGGYRVLPMHRPQLDGVRPEWAEEE